MRISTSQFYSSNTTNIVNRQSDLNQSIINISEGKRVITAGDDSVAATSILNFKQERALTEQFQTNIVFADSRINGEENALQTAEEVMFRIKDLIIQGNSVANDGAARQAIADELKARFDELLSLGNSKDESGSFVFGGFQTETPPFQRQSDNSVTYVGDQGQRLTSVGPGVQVPTSDDGSKLFMTVPNDTGDFTPSYSLDTSHDEVERAVLTSANIVDRPLYNSTSNPDYNINFQEVPLGSGNMEVEVVDALLGVVYPSAPYVAGGTVSFDGIEITMTRQPQDGDQITITPEKNVDVFSVVNDAIEWMERDNGVGVDEAKRQIDMGHILGDIDKIQIRLGNVRAEIGSRLQITESQSERHLDYTLTLETSRSNLEDLDMVEAISTFERQKLALQASQTAFAQTQDLSLLNFI